jgi:hypothetical protein
MASDDGDGSWARQLLLGLGALAGVALLVGLVVGALTIGAVSITGLGESSGSASSRPSLYIPTAEPTTSPQPYPDPVGPSNQPTRSDEPSPTPSEQPSRTKKPRTITLQAFPGHVSPSERIYLTGVYQDGEGAGLQVQRFEGHWVDFPVDATVRGGIFDTYVITGRSGVNRFRVVDTGTGRASNPVSVTVG